MVFAQMANDQALQGVASLILQLREMGAMDDGKAIRRAVRAGMKPALSIARITIPVSKKPHKTYKGNTVQPGFARDSLRIVTTLSPDKQMATALLGPRKEAFYATTFVELGTSRAAPHPWLRPSFYSTQNDQKAAIKASLEAYLKRVAKKQSSGGGE